MMKPNLTVIKIGGNVINNEESLNSFLADFSKIQGYKILIHGGGKKATEVATGLGLQPKMIGGRRITDKANLEIVTMVYAGLLNKNIVSQLQKQNCNALGLSGADANCILAHKRIVNEIDYGFAGDVDEVNTNAIKLFLEGGMTPVFCAITHDRKGQLLNTNADTIASEIAKGMSEVFKVELIYCFEKNGVLLNVEDDDSVIENIDLAKYNDLKEQNIIVEGMLPKMENCYAALKKGVDSVVIGNPSFIANKDQKHTRLKL